MSVNLEKLTAIVLFFCDELKLESEATATRVMCYFGMTRDPRLV
jgi:hypothetical protein